MKKSKSIKLIPTLSVVITLIITMSCSPKVPSDLARESLIPKPVSVAATGDYFTLTPKTIIHIQSGSDELKNNADYLAGRLRPATGFGLEINATDNIPKKWHLSETFN